MSTPSVLAPEAMVSTKEHAYRRTETQSKTNPASDPAQATDQGALTFEAAIALVRRQSPELKRTRAALGLAHARVAGGAPFDPLEFRFGRQLSSASGESDQRLAARFHPPNPMVWAAKQAGAEAEGKALEQDYLAAARDLEFAVAEAYGGLVFAEAEKKELLEEAALSRQQAKFDEELLEEGYNTASDNARDELAYWQLVKKIDDLEYLVEDHRHHLESLLGIGASNAHVPSRTFAQIIIDRASHRVREGHLATPSGPSLERQAAAHRKRAADKQLTAHLWKRLPWFGFFQVERRDRETLTFSNQEWNASLALSLPLFEIFGGDSKVPQAKKAQAEVEHALIADEEGRMLAQAIKRFERAQTHVKNMEADLDTRVNRMETKAKDAVQAGMESRRLLMYVEREKHWQERMKLAANTRLYYAALAVLKAAGEPVIAERD